MNVADALVSRRYDDGELIIKQGDSADCMFFVEDGEIKITAKKAVRHTGLSYLIYMDYFNPVGI